MSYSRTQPHNNFFQINDYLTLRLEGGVTNIFINGVLFNQCKFLLFNIFGNTPEKYDIIESIDEAETVLDRRMESRDRGGIDPYTEFWGHCSNLQAWYENDYNTCILHRNLAFPLLQALTKAGDPVAKKVFKEEIVTRFLSGFIPVMEFLLEQGFLNYLGKEELEVLFDQIDFSTIFSQKGFMKSRFFDMIIQYIRGNTKFLNDIFKQCLQKSLISVKQCY